MRIAEPTLTRPCRFRLALQDDCVFADFDVDEDGAVFPRLISYDGYGAHRIPSDVPRMDRAGSAALLAMIDRGALDPPVVERVLRAYFEAHRAQLWADALAEHGLL